MQVYFYKGKRQDFIGNTAFVKFVVVRSLNLY
jgi:hypothetical protein